MIFAICSPRPRRRVPAIASPVSRPKAPSRWLQRDSRLQWASPNFFQDWQKFFTPNDPIFSQQWHLNNTGQNGGLAGADISAEEAWDMTRGAGVRLALVDNGIEVGHPDLAAFWKDPAVRALAQVASQGQ